MTNDECDSDDDTSMSPQEWFMYLEDVGLISNETVEMKKGPAVCKTAVKSLQSCVLPPTAILFRPCDFFGVIEVKDRVSQGLLWLHEASYQDLSVLQTALLDMQLQKALLDDRSHLYKANATLANQEFVTLCKDLVLSKDILNIDSENIPQAVKEWNETQALKSREGTEGILSRHYDFLSAVVAHYRGVCKRTLQQPHISNLLSKEEYSIDKVRMDLEELVAFYLSRHVECSKQSIPSFMTLVSSDNIDTLKETQERLQKILQEKKSGQCRVVGSREVKLMEAAQGRVHQLRQRVEENELEIQEVDEKIQLVQQDIEWCRKRIESVKATMEKDIASLMANDDVGLTQIKLVV